MSGRKKYASAPEVAAIAKLLIEHFHPHLRGVRIEYVWVNKPPVIGGQPKDAVMRKVSGLYAYLATPGTEGEPKPFFVMEVCRPLWLTSDTAGHVALVDHELKHGGSDEGAIYIVPHDIEEFDDVAARHGAWHEGLESFAAALDEGSAGSFRLEGLPLKNNREQRNAFQKGAKRKSEWKAPEVTSTH